MTINEVLKQIGLSIFTLGYYEKQGLIPDVHRDTSGHRNYTEFNLEIIGFIQKLKATGMPLKKILAYISLIDKEIEEACSKSLKRVGVEAIDLYQIHRLSPGASIQKVFDVLDSLVKRIQKNADKDIALITGKITEKRGIKAAQVALAWLLSKKDVAAPIVGVSKLYQLDEAVDADNIKLCDDEIKSLEELYLPKAHSGITPPFKDPGPGVLHDRG